MTYSLEIIKGIHPGIIIARELKKRGLSLEQFAISIGVAVAVIADIINGNAEINFALASTIEKTLEMDDGLLLKFQSFYDLKQKEDGQAAHYKPDLSKFRPALFWDTRIENINWHRQQKSIIHRVFERGNFSEKKELIRFYGIDFIKAHLGLQDDVP
ncbi:MAG TPA: helix-turn-helix domain-containing protein [Flavipsychrobacter sp.]|nr:helix-turn-helix domain-containing protein [Flavipsychrobacter sp.]